MNKNNIDITSVVKLTTSLKDVLANQKPHVHFTPDQKKLFDEFFGSNGGDTNPIVELYFQAISQINTNPSPDPSTGTSPSDEAKTFVDNMNAIFRMLVNRENNSDLLKYESQSRDMFMYFDNHIVEIFKSNYIKGLSPAGIKSIQDLLFVWAQTDLPLLHPHEFFEFEKAMNTNGTPLEPRINEAIFTTFLRVYADMAKPNSTNQLGKTTYFGYGGDKEFLAGAYAFDMHWIDYTIKMLKNGTVDDLWKDDISNGIFQMLNQRVINLRNYHFRGEDTDKDMTVAKATYISNNPSISETDYPAAYDVMEDIVKLYSDKPIQDDIVLEEFAKAYEIVYMHDLITDTQKPDEYTGNHNLRKYSLFALMQSEAFLGYEGDKFDPEVLMRRAIQDLNLKESSRKFSYVFHNRIRNRVLTIGETDPDATLGRMGHSDDLAQVITMTFPKKIDKNSPNKRNIPKELITTAYHEQAHIASGNRIHAGLAIDFGAYVYMQTQMVRTLSQLVDVRKESDLYEECKADLAGLFGFIKALREFPVGRDENTLKGEIKSLKKEIKAILFKINSNPLMIYNQKEKKWIKAAPVKVFDLFFKNHIAKLKLAGKLQSDIASVLLFEYREDGTPKSLKEILEDQQKEIDSAENYTAKMVNYQFGPLTMPERIKLRMQIMMRRAIVNYQEAECVTLINDFINKAENKKYFGEKSYFKDIFPGQKFPSVAEAADAVGKFAIKENERDFEKAEFMVSVYCLAKALEDRTNAKNSKDPKNTGDPKKPNQPKDPNNPKDPKGHPGSPDGQDGQSDQIPL